MPLVKWDKECSPLISGRGGGGGVVGFLPPAKESQDSGDNLSIRAVLGFEAGQRLRELLCQKVKPRASLFFFFRLVFRFSTPPQTGAPERLSGRRFLGLHPTQPHPTHPTTDRPTDQPTDQPTHPRRLLPAPGLVSGARTAA